MHHPLQTAAFFSPATREGGGQIPAKRIPRPPRKPYAKKGSSAPGDLARAPLDDLTFKAQLVALIPHLRAFGYSLAGGGQGDDLAQTAMLKAWVSRASYEAGTNMKSWTFAILRNVFLSEKRRSWRSQPLDPGVAEAMLTSNDDPVAAESLVDVRNAMQRLPDDQREALILAGAGGLSYEETAKICGCAVGTVKSRVSRARKALAEILQSKDAGRRARTTVSSSTVFDGMMRETRELQGRLGAMRVSACLASS